jgi:TPR repeat protein
MKYRNGDGVPQSDAEAANWLQAAAAEGQANAQYELAMAYMGGRGVPRDYVSAYVWLVAAKASGDSRSENQAKLLTAKLSDLDIARIRARLGEMYWRGIGVPSDYVAAYTWLILAEKAGEKGTTTAAKIELASAMTQDQVAEARERASLWLRRHQRCASCPPDVGKRKFTVGTKAGGRRSNLHRRVYPSQRGGVSQ